MAKRKAGALGDFNAIPMPITLGNCIGWLSYGFITKNPYVVAANFPGVLLGLWYTMTMLRISDAPTARKVETVAMLMVGIHVAAGTVSAFFLPDRAAIASLYGIVCNAILLAYYGAPLSTIGTVLKTKSAASIFLPTVLINGLNGVFWSVYAMAIKDNYLLAPNAIGATLASIQVVLCLIFGGKK